MKKNITTIIIITLLITPFLLRADVPLFVDETEPEDTSGGSGTGWTYPGTGTQGGGSSSSPQSGTSSNSKSNFFVNTEEASHRTYTTVVLHGNGGDKDSNSKLPLTAYFRYSSAAISPVYCNDIYGTNMHSTKDIKLGSTFDNIDNKNGNSYDESKNTNYFYQKITNLTPDTLYYYCAILSNKNTISSIPNYGEDSLVKFFRTSPYGTTVNTKSATSIKPTSVKLNASYSSISNVSVYFEFREATTSGPNPWEPTPKQNYNLSGNTSIYGDFDIVLIDLDPDTTYQFRAVATTTSGTGTNAENKTVYGSVLNFTTDTTDSDNGNGGQTIEKQNNPKSPKNPKDPTNKDDPYNPDSPKNPYNPNYPQSPKNKNDPKNVNDLYNPKSPNNPYNPNNPNPKNSKDLVNKDDPYNPDSPKNPYNPDYPTTPKNPNDPKNKNDVYNPSNPNNPYHPNYLNKSSTNRTTKNVNTNSGSGCTSCGSSNYSNNGTQIYSAGGIKNPSMNLYSNNNNSSYNSGYNGGYSNNSNNSGGNSGAYSNNNTNIIDTTPLKLGQTFVPPNNAIVHYQEGIETVFARQIMADVDFAKKYGYETGKDMQTFAWYLSDELARMFGYVDESGKEIRVSKPDVAAYQLQLSGNTLTVYEYYENKIIDVRNVSASFKDKSEYEYYFKKN